MSSLVYLHRPQQRRELFGVDPCKVCLVGWSQNIGWPNLTCWITFRISVGNCVAKDLPYVLHCPLGQISRATALDHFDHRDQFRSFNFSDGARTKQRKDVCVHAPPRRVDVLRALLSTPMVKPEFRDRLEGILGRDLFCVLCRLPLHHRIKANSEQSASLGVAFPG